MSSFLGGKKKEAEMQGELEGTILMILTNN
jgi:hypothetical protein